MALLHYTLRNQISLLLDKLAHGTLSRLIEASPEFYDLSVKLHNDALAVRLKEYRDALPTWGFSWRWPFIRKINRHPLDVVMAELLSQEVQGSRIRDYVLGNKPYM